jgi:hypothetical protein
VVCAGKEADDGKGEGKRGWWESTPHSVIPPIPPRKGKDSTKHSIGSPEIADPTDRPPREISSDYSAEERDLCIG